MYTALDMGEEKTLQGKWIMITGASKGLGREMALVFAEAGADLILTARSADMLDELQLQVEQGGGECLTVAGDIREQSTLARLADLAREKDLDILVNNAGVVDITKLEEVSDDRIDEVIDLNLVAPIKLTRAVIGAFKQRGRGTIVFVNSAGGKRGVPDHTVYCASKYGISGFIESLKIEVKGLGIRIISVCPGKMATELFNAADRSMDTSQFIPPREVAEGVLYMLDMSSKCSHADLSVDRMS
jgi:short-subunit dehydrogenase